jgi:hypothetical protein
MNQANLDEPSKPYQSSQNCNSLNPRPKMNQEIQFPTNLILISQGKFNKEQQIKRPEKT